MPMLILMLGTVKDLDSMVDLAKDMVDTGVLMEAILDTEPMELLMEVTDDSGEEFIFS